MPLTTELTAAEFDAAVLEQRRNVAAAVDEHKADPSIATVAIWRAELIRLDRLVKRRDAAAVRRMSAA